MSRGCLSGGMSMSSRSNVRTLLPVIVLAAVFSLTPAVRAKGPDPAGAGSAYDERGYQRDSVYTGVDGPAVNAFNFNFVFDLPFQIGLEYPENANVTLRLALTYNSRVWRWQNVALHRKFLRVRRQNPYGLGFDINLGRIISTQMKGSTSPYTYVDASGAEHRL